MTQQNSHYESGIEKSAVGHFYFDPKKNYIETRTSTSE